MALLLVPRQKPPSPDKGRVGGLYLPYDKKLTAKAREHRKNPTPAESLIWNKALRCRQSARYKFLRQKPIGSHIVDFYCSEFQLVVEIAGDSHARQIGYDGERTRFLNSLGLEVLRYANHEVLHSLAGVCRFVTPRRDQARVTRPGAAPAIPCSNPAPQALESPCRNRPSRPSCRLNRRFPWPRTPRIPHPPASCSIP